MNRIKKALNNRNIDLTCPESWLLKQPKKPYKVSGCFCGFIIIGVVFQQKYPFPYFYFFLCMFLFIVFLCFWAEQYYCKAIRKITDELRHQNCASDANDFIATWGTQSPIFVAAPIATLLIFGVGGCQMFGAIRLTPTLMWVLLLFSVAVMTSIVGYVQYVCLAVYLAKLSHPAGRYKGLEKGPVNYTPAEISWIQELVKLSHTYRTTFFTVGGTYIISFSSFCFWPDMSARTSSPWFYILWFIIFVAIVLAFPIISSLEYKWIKQIIHHLKKSYIYDLEREQNLLKKSQSKQLVAVIISISARQILDSKDYPFRSTLGIGYAIAMTFINFLTTITTIFTDTLPFINDLWQSFL